MGEDVKINGMKLTWPLLIAALTFTFWLGGLSITVYGQGDDIKDHSAIPAHAAAALATNTVQADVKHNTKEIDKINKKLDDIEVQMEEDKDEILDAIREHDDSS